MVLTLYKMNASLPVRAVLMTIEALQIPDVEYVDVDLFKAEHMTEEYGKINPLLTVPTLKDDDFVISDSHAICGYLVSTYGENDSLYPKAPKIRAIVDQRLHFDSGILYPAASDALRLVLRGGEKTFRKEMLNKIQSAYELTNKFLIEEWIAGKDLTVADISCISTISSMNDILPIDEKKYTNLWNWYQRCTQLPFYKTMNEPGLQELRKIVKSKME